MQKRACLQHGVKGTHSEPGLLLLLLSQEACEENGIRASEYVTGENLRTARWKEPEKLGADCQKKLSQSGRQGQPQPPLLPTVTATSPQQGGTNDSTEAAEIAAAPLHQRSVAGHSIFLPMAPSCRVLSKCQHPAWGQRAGYMGSREEEPAAAM